MKLFEALAIIYVTSNIVYIIAALYYKVREHHRYMLITSMQIEEALHKKSHI